MAHFCRANNWMIARISRIANQLTGRTMPVIKLPKPKLILMKIDGVTSGREFIGKELLPYALDHAEEFLTEHWGDEDVLALIKYMQKESDIDEDGPAIKHQVKNEGRLLRETLDYVRYLFDKNRSTMGRQMLYLLVWGDGFASGKLKSHIFPDAGDAIFCWHKFEIPMCVFAGGNPTCNKMIFTFSREVGNLHRFITKYLDCKVYGNKDDEDSYDMIAKEFKCKAKEILFLTDDLREAAAARDARCKCVLIKRPGNAEVSQSQLDEIGVKAVERFTDIVFDIRE